MSQTLRDLRVLVVDDSASNRRNVTTLLAEHPGVQVVGRAADGDEALRLCASLSPDLVTLDLQMPRMDGFTFLRLLMATRPTAVVVISSQTAREDVFRALELGAIDFIAKPDVSAPADALRAQLSQILAMVRQLSPARVQLRRVSPGGRPATPWPAPTAATGSMRRVIALAASTGGPTALMEVFAGLPEGAQGGLVIAQHMPERFTKSFAERLDRQGPVRAREAEHGFELVAGTALVSPGGRCMELEQRDGRLVARVLQPAITDRYAPSADRLLTSVARAAGDKAVAVVLTGMGDDAAAGIRAIKAAGGLVLSESEQTAVVFGMPKVAAQTGCVDEVLPLPEIVTRLRGLLLP
jgi:two-component system chemotaxis response regulator CheB